MTLLIQPEDGIGPLLSGIRSAEKSVEIMIFRFDRSEIEAALKAAVTRGVAVTALIAYTNRGGEINLRKLEMRLLEVGVTVSRTAGDLVRYHDKILIIDRRQLYILSFNFTHLDIDNSRGFGIVTRNVQVVREAVNLFEADVSRQPYTASLDAFLVSPVNARKGLATFLRKAKKQLYIYDPLIADTEMLRILKERAKAGVQIQIIGRAGGRSPGLEVRKLAGLRLHTRTIIRDGRQAFIGSQSLRKAELDSRREVGIIVHDAKTVHRLLKTFEADWEREADEETAKVPKRAVKALVKELSPLSPIVKAAVKQVAEETDGAGLNVADVKAEVKAAVKEAVQDAVRDRVKEIVRDSVEGS